MKNYLRTRSTSFWIEALFPFVAGFVSVLIAKYFKIWWPYDDARYIGLIGSTISVCAILAGLVGVVMALLPMVAATKLFARLKEIQNDKTILFYLSISMVLNGTLVGLGLIGYFIKVPFTFWLFLVISDFINFTIINLTMVGLLFGMVHDT